MRFSLCFVLFCAISATAASRVKRGLTEDEQKKLLEVLNADRQALGKKLNSTFEILTYSVTLEKKGDVNYVSRRFFKPDHKRIGCSKEKKCSHTIEAGDVHEPDQSQLVGKTVKSWGACTLAGATSSWNDSHTPEKHGMPSYEKYGDLLGVVGDPQDSPTGSSGRFFSLTLFLGSILAFNY
ncbi:unnamed protein product [Caenorhabditis nigoni]